MEIFKVGDRVKVKSNANTINRRIVGKMGTIKGCVFGRYAVEFDKKVGTSSCGGLTKDGFGWLCAEEILSVVKNETIVIYRNGQKVIALDKSTGKKAEAKCNPNDEFDFYVGAELAFNRLMGGDAKLDDGVREVKRKAKVGEYVKVVNEMSIAGLYKNGEIFKAINVTPAACICKNYEKQVGLWHEEYVVLENYKPEKEPEKKDEICVGDTVKVVDVGRQYDTYDTWSGLHGYKQNFVTCSSVSNVDHYKVLVIKKHDTDNRKTVALIQNPKTTQVFMIGIEGLKKVER